MTTMTSTDKAELSRAPNLNIKLVPQASTDTFQVLLDELKLWRKNEGKRAWGKLEPEVLRIIELIMLDLFTAWTSSPELLVGYSRNAQEFLKGGRYWDDKTSSKLFSQTVYLDVVDGLVALNYAEDFRAKQATSGKSSRIRATQKLIVVMKDNGINWAALDTSPEPSKVITLTTEKDGNDRKHLIEFDDNADEHIPAMREALVKINDRLRETLINLSVTDDELVEINRRLADGKEREVLDFTNRYLIRKFTNGDFASGGRYYGGWWQDIPREYRKFIQIQGKPTIELDYSTLHPTILYLKEGLKPPKDSYDLEGWDKEHRSIYKKAFNQLLNSSHSTRKKTQWFKLAPDLLEQPLPSGWNNLNVSQKGKLNRQEFTRLTGRNFEELIETILEKHQPIQHYFFTQAWSWLQRLDSDIAEGVMLKMLDEEDIPVLPLHDSFIVRAIFKDNLSKVMEETFREAVQGDPTIDAKESLLDGVGKFYSLRDYSYDDYLEDQKTHSGYHQRNTEWKQVWGLNGWD
jgi:hypothetical protein